MTRKLSVVVIGTLLVLVTIGGYGQIYNHSFVSIDDPDYVTQNFYIKQGFSKETLIWAFSTFHAANWHPLTWLSHILDYQLFASEPSGHHLTSLLFHLCNALLLFLVLERMTGALWKSGFVAALFALHPLHVESVAWIAERKDVLCTFFWMLTLWTYFCYTKNRSAHRYLLVLFCFTLGLLSKPMIVSLPIVLILLDFWPLERIRFDEFKKQNTGKRAPLNIFFAEENTWKLLVEKVPFFILAGGASILTYFAQKSGGTINSFEMLPFETRLANALVSYFTYIEKTFWPENLAFFYPYDTQNLSMGKSLLAGLFFVSMGILSLRLAHRFPYFMVGWFWYVITLVPVIGLIQVGGQSMADRYTYVPLIGIFMIAGWSIPRLVSNGPYKTYVLFALASFAILVCFAKTVKQVSYWKDDALLSHHALEVTQNNYFAHHNLGLAKESVGDLEGAISQFSKALQFYPNFVQAHGNLGRVLSKQGRNQESKRHFLKALRINPQNALVHAHLGKVYVEEGKMSEGVDHLIKAIRLDPTQDEAHYNLGQAYFIQGQFKNAIPYFTEALRISSNEAMTNVYLGLSLAQTGKIKEGETYLIEAKQLGDSEAKVPYYFGAFYSLQGKYEESIPHYSKALTMDPDYADAHFSLGQAMAYLGENENATFHFSEVVRINARDWEAYNNLGVVLLKTGKIEEAILQFSKAIKINPDFESANNNLNYALEIQSSTQP